MSRSLRRWVQRTPLRAPATRVWLFTGLLGALAVAVYVLDIHWRPPIDAPIRLPWPLVALACLLAETRVIVVHYQRETHSFSLSEIPAVLGLFFLTPDEFLLAVIGGSAAALLFTARQSLIKVAFNLSNFALISVLTLAIFREMAAVAGRPGPVEWLAAFVAMLAAVVVGGVTIAAAISLSGGAPQFQKLPEMLRFGGLVALANTSLALLAVSVMWVDPGAGWLLGVPLVTLYLAYQAYISEREKHERLELVYQSSRILQHSEIDSAIVALLDHLRDMFRAEIAEIVLYPDSSADVALRTRSTHDAPPDIMVPAALEPNDPLHARVTGDPKPFFMGSPSFLLGDRMVRQAMISPLRGESGLIGAMIVANRLTEGTTFDPDDLRLLETVANQAAVALENGQLERSLAELSRLKEELRFQAFHDPLTALANRTMFVDEVDKRLAASDPGAGPIVLFLDLDDFKIVNDTLGHASGDALLAAAAERIRSCVRAGDLVARLGGDEFAILLAEEQSVDRALSVATRIIESLQGPFPIAGQDIVVGGSIGVAVARGHDQTAGELLRNADVAMYTAKAAGKRRYSVFEPTMHAAIVARHALSNELARSVRQGELAVFYQPIVELETGRAVGLEALLRWRHPARGLITPDDFIALAEENGTILEIGAWVLAEACLQGANWQARLDLPPGFFVSVNMSPRQVQQPDLIALVEATLASAGLDPASLVLELTETAMFQDTEATVTKLQSLRAQGVRIALDDFGTGYSSLGYLRRFPVDALKIAREFVVPVEQDADWAFAHAILALGHTLGLDIIAEGIETPLQAARLRDLGCVLGQGFHFAHPVPAADVEGVLAARRAESRRTVA